MKISTDNAIAAGKAVSKLYREDRRGYYKQVEDFKAQVVLNKEMTDREKKDALWYFERNR